MQNIFKNYIFPVVTLTGSMIGVGFLSLPYIALKVGALTMSIYFLALTILMVVLHSMVGQISLKTPDFKRWPGFIGFYFGDVPKKIMMGLIVMGVFGVMLIYLIVGSQFLSVILSGIFGSNSLLYVLLYFGAASLCIYFGVRAISRVDFLALILLLVIMGLIFLKGLPYMNIQNLQLFPVGTGASFVSQWFLPYGAILFSLWGAPFIPEIEEMMRGDKKSLSVVIITATLITAIFYFLFTFLVVSITGGSTTESALVGLKEFLGTGVASVAVFMGVITIFIALIAEGLLLKKIFIYDMGMSHFSAFALTCFVPLALFLLGVNSFIPLVSFIGGVLLSIDGILILLMYKKIGGSKLLVYPLVLFFILGIIYSIVY